MRPRRRTAAAQRAATWLWPTAAVVLATSCADVVRYTHELNDPSSGRSLFVTTPASLGALCGFVAGVPVDVAALPVTLPIYLLQDDEESPADPLSTMLLPSFVLWRAGTLVAMPFDALEFVAWRMWQPPETMTREEREEWESRLDRKALPTYSVEWVFPAAPPADHSTVRPALQPLRPLRPLQPVLQRVREPSLHPSVGPPQDAPARVPPQQPQQPQQPQLPPRRER